MAPRRTSDELDLNLDREQNASLLGSDRIEDRWREASEDNDRVLEDVNPSEYDAMSVEERKRLWRRNAIVNSFFIAAWFGFATLLSLYNKWMFSAAYFGFPFPLFVTSMHMVVQFACSSMIRMLWPAVFKPPGRPTVKEYAQKCVPCAVTTGLDIGLSNLSLKTITLSLYTMCKSSSLIFVLLFAFLFRLERFSIRLVAVILLITAGVLLMVLSTDVAGHGPPGPPATPSSSESAAAVAATVRRALGELTSMGVDVFRRVPEQLKTPMFVGVIFVFMASAFGGLRWALTQLLLTGSHGSHNEKAQPRPRRYARTRTPASQDKPRSMGLNNPAATIFFLSPTMFLTLFIVSTLLEGPLPKLATSGFFDSFMGGLKTTGYILFPGALAFAMVLSEYYIIQRTGMVPMSIAGIFKEVITILLSTWFFGDSLTWVNWIGLTITISGIAVFTYHKYQKSVSDPSASSPLRNGGIALPEYEDGRPVARKTDVDDVVDIDELEQHEDRRLMDDDDARLAWNQSADDHVRSESVDELGHGGEVLLFDVDRDVGSRRYSKAENTTAIPPVSPFANGPSLYAPSPIRPETADILSPVSPSTTARSKNRDRRDRKVRFSVVEDGEGKVEGNSVSQGPLNEWRSNGPSSSSQTLDFR